MTYHTVLLLYRQQTTDNSSSPLLMFARTSIYSVYAMTCYGPGCVSKCNVLPRRDQRGSTEFRFRLLVYLSCLGPLVFFVKRNMILVYYYCTWYIFLVFTAALQPFFVCLFACIRDVLGGGQIHRAKTIRFPRDPCMSQRGVSARPAPSPTHTFIAPQAHAPTLPEEPVH